MAEYTFYELMIRGEVPEEGRPAAAHVVLRDSRLRQVGPITLESANKLGVALPDIFDMALRAMIDRAEKAESIAEKAEAERDDALQSRAQAAGAALQAREALGAKLVEIDTLRQERDAALAEVARLSQAPEGPSNPMLNALSFGLLGK